ncbi:hypothetical protein ABN154_25555 [Klebsiella michiganensis]|uniref:hypothetical protein n=1 Tax=Klebsiella michiganensis TaxID=1134687 RepID=UPI00288F6693|nr:hypothetical protein [Klebsiella michiganensis]
MTINTVVPEGGNTVNIRLSVYEKLFSVMSEVNYRCGPGKGEGIHMSDIFRVLINQFLGGLFDVDEIGFRVQMRDRAAPDAFMMTVAIDTETFSALEEITQSLNGYLKFPEDIQGEDILELLVMRHIGDIRRYLLDKGREGIYRPVRH